MRARVIVQIVIFLALQGAVLFVAAGTVAWPGACAFLGIMGAGAWAISVWLLKHDPALHAERLSPVVQRRQMDLREHTSGSDIRGEPHLYPNQDVQLTTSSVRCAPASSRA